jgi:predicted GNAT family acetyltransferase
MRFELTRDATEFAARAQHFVEARVERGVLATVLLGAQRGYFGDGLFACGVDADGRVAAAALRTPPWPMVVSELDHADADTLISAWLGHDPELPGVTGLTASAQAVAEAWDRATGGSWAVAVREALHVLDELRDPPRPASGRLREGRAEERELLIEWERAFAHEAGLTGDHGARLVDARLTYHGVYLWDDGGPVCLVGNAAPAAGVVRLGPVYTPPELRGRGYASSAVAARSRLAIESGLRCTLFTDLANPTSNKIYADVGYRRVADWNEISFTRSPT